MRHKNGFTLVELLAVVVILGVIIMMSIPAVNRWIDRSKETSDDGLKKTLVMAAQSYAQSNTDTLPKVVGGTSNITAQELKKANYLNEDLVNSEKKDCMDSYVTILKTSKGQYKYIAYMVCDGDTIIADTTKTKPTISISFIGIENEDEQITDVQNAGFKIVIDGGSTATKKYMLASYSYSISVRYTGDANDKIVEIYNTGNVETGQRDRVVIEKGLSEYTDITTANDFIITVEAYNSIGGYRKQSLSSSYKDTDPPKCGTITGQAKDEHDWLRTSGKTRTISVECEDGDGSGCVKDIFTKTFDIEMDEATITIADNAGNTTNCIVKVQIDWTRPTLIVEAYVRNPDKSNGNFAAKKEANEENPTMTMDTYVDNVSGWLNYEKYPKGLNFDITVKDNIKLANGQWSSNRPAIFSPNDDDLDTLIEGASKLFTVEDNKTTDKLEDNGIRRAKYTLKDAADNTVTVKIKAKIDHNNPSMKISKDKVDSTEGVTIIVDCTDGESGCVKNKKTYEKVKETTTYTIEDNAGNKTSETVNIIKYVCDTEPCNPHKCHKNDGTTSDSYTCSGTVASNGGSCCSNGGGSCTQLFGQLSCSCTKTVTIPCSHTCYDTCNIYCYR